MPNHAFSTATVRKSKKNIHRKSPFNLLPHKERPRFLLLTRAYLSSSKKKAQWTYLPRKNVKFRVRKRFFLLPFSLIHAIFFCTCAMLGLCQYVWVFLCISALMQSNDCETVMKTAQMEWNRYILLRLMCYWFLIFFLFVIEKERKILTVEIGGKKLCRLKNIHT